ncbi:MAG: type II toxin-antitoxin system VapC family toxin [Acidobacteria bacterium]|nr:type II toxin-antitoxin system VapC family toxin [Acidobacteriota bacterium]
MRLLLDTHTFLWFLLNDAQLTETARSLIADSGNDIEISPASIWEIAIKISLGKYALTEPLEAFMEREMTANGFRLLALEIKHISVVTTLPFHHRDPFDRLLVAQDKVPC